MSTYINNFEFIPEPRVLDVDLNNLIAEKDDIDTDFVFETGSYNQGLESEIVILDGVFVHREDYSTIGEEEDETIPDSQVEDLKSMIGDKVNFVCEKKNIDDIYTFKSMSLDRERGQSYWEYEIVLVKR